MMREDAAFPFTLKDDAGSGCDFSHCLPVENAMAS